MSGCPVVQCLNVRVSNCPVSKCPVSSCPVSSCLVTSGFSLVGVSGGKRTDTSLLKAGPETFMIQITNVNPELLADYIKVYVRSKDNDIKVLNVEDLSAEGWSTKRFALTVDYNYESHGGRLLASEDLFQAVVSQKTKQRIYMDNKLSIMSYNSTGLAPEKRDYIKEFLQTHNPDIVFTGGVDSQ